MKHKIIYQAEPEVQAPASLETQIKTAITTALNAQDIDLPCEINVLVTGSDGIQDINSTMRSVDQPTDVLSFPMFQLTPGDKPAPEDADPETGLIPLGDMVLSLNQARAQAQEYGHSLEREVSYLTVHSVLHLLGYDHLDEGPQKAQMREREEAIMARLGVSRTEEKGEIIMDKKKKVILTKIEPETIQPELEPETEGSGSLLPLVVAGTVFGATLAICRRLMKHPYRRGR